MKNISSKYFHFLLHVFDSKIVPILQNMGVGTVTQIQAVSSSIANLEFSTKIWRNDEPKELGSTTFVTKIWTRVPHPNPYECWLHAPNVGSSSTLFVPNKKEHKRLWRNREKNAPHFSLSALGIAETTSSLRSSPLTATLFGLLLRYTHFRMPSHSQISFRLPLRGALTKPFVVMRKSYASSPTPQHLLS